MEQALTLRVKTNQWAIVTVAASEGGGEGPAPCQRSQVFLFFNLWFFALVTYLSGTSSYQDESQG